MQPTISCTSCTRCTITAVATDAHSVPAVIMFLYLFLYLYLYVLCYGRSSVPNTFVMEITTLDSPILMRATLVKVFVYVFLYLFFYNLHRYIFVKKIIALNSPVLIKSATLRKEINCICSFLFLCYAIIIFC